MLEMTYITLSCVSLIVLTAFIGVVLSDILNGMFAPWAAYGDTWWEQRNYRYEDRELMFNELISAARPLDALHSTTPRSMSYGMVRTAQGWR